MGMSKWYQSQEIDNIIISNRIRLARNIKDYRFPARMDEHEALALIAQVKLAVGQLSKYDFTCIELKDIEKIDKKQMMEHHIMSPYMFHQSLPGMMVVNQDETISMMVNEEDHLRLQGINSGADLLSTWKTVTQLDDDIEGHIPYAFSGKYGYMTACPTNLGTGIRASYMVHLPLLKKTGYLKKMLEDIGKLGMSIRGIYGEGTKSLGSIYQISNQRTLGRSEEDIIEGVQNITSHMVEQEQNLRNIITSDSKSQLIDQVYRSYGILTFARRLKLSETMNLLSDVKLGFELDIYDMPKPKKNIFEMMIDIQEATIAKVASKEENPLPTDAIRANVIRKYLKINEDND